MKKINTSTVYWKNFTEKGAIASMIVGFFSIPIFKFLVPNLDTIGIYFDKTAELLPSFILGLLTGYLVSKIYPDKKLTCEFEALLKTVENQ